MLWTKDESFSASRRSEPSMDCRSAQAPSVDPALVSINTERVHDPLDPDVAKGRHRPRMLPGFTRP